MLDHWINRRSSISHYQTMILRMKKNYILSVYTSINSLVKNFFSLHHLSKNIKSLLEIGNQDDFISFLFLFIKKIANKLKFLRGFFKFHPEKIFREAFLKFWVFFPADQPWVVQNFSQFDHCWKCISCFQHIFLLLPSFPIL